MRYVNYMKNCVWELLLCALVSCSLSMIIFNGFYIADELQKNYLNIILVVVLTTSLCLAGAYNKKSIVIASGCGIAAVAAVLIVFQQIGASENVFRDSESNPGVYFLILVLTSLIVFLLSRTKTGTWILFIAGSFVASAIQFLYETAAVWMVIVFLLAAGSLYVFRNYQKNVLQTETVKVDFGKTFATSIVACFLIVALATGVFYGIVKPLDPPERELKLITKYMALEVLEKMGVADTHIINDSDDRTDNTNDNDRESNKKGDKEDQSQGEKTKQEDKNKKDQKNNPTKLDELFNQMFYAIKYIASLMTPFVLIPLILILIAAAIITKLLLRKRWFRKIQTEDRRIQIIKMYHFYLKKFKKMKIRKAPEETALEFAERSAAYLQEFCVGSTTFKEITDIFVRIRYSCLDVEDGDYESYLMFHKMFYKNCREHLGTFKYIMKFFTL